MPFIVDVQGEWIVIPLIHRSPNWIGHDIAKKKRLFWGHVMLCFFWLVRRDLQLSEWTISVININLPGKNATIFGGLLSPNLPRIFVAFLLDHSKNRRSCGWKNSESPVHSCQVYPIIHRVSPIPGGAGVLPSTVGHTHWTWERSSSWSTWSWRFFEDWFSIDRWRCP